MTTPKTSIPPRRQKNQHIMIMSLRRDCTNFACSVAAQYMLDTQKTTCPGQYTRSSVHARARYMFAGPVRPVDGSICPRDGVHPCPTPAMRHAFDTAWNCGRPLPPRHVHRQGNIATCQFIPGNLTCLAAPAHVHRRCPALEVTDR